MANVAKSLQIHDTIGTLAAMKACSGAACPCSKAVAELEYTLQSTNLKDDWVRMVAPIAYPGLIIRLAGILLRGGHRHEATLAVSEAYST